MVIAASTVTWLTGQMLMQAVLSVVGCSVIELWSTPLPLLMSLLPLYQQFIMICHFTHPKTNSSHHKRLPTKWCLEFIDSRRMFSCLYCSKLTPKSPGMNSWRHSGPGYMCASAIGCPLHLFTLKRHCPLSMLFKSFKELHCGDWTCKLYRWDKVMENLSEYHRQQRYTMNNQGIDNYLPAIDVLLLFNA